MQLVGTQTRRQQHHLATGQQPRPRPGPSGVVTAFGAVGPAGGDVLAQPAPPIQVTGQHHHAPAVGHRAADREAGTWQQGQAALERLGVCTHHTGHGTVIGERQRLVTQRVCPCHQLFRVGCPLLKTEVGQGAQLGIPRQRRNGGHAYTPCKNQRAPGGTRYTHSNPTRGLRATK